MRTFLIIYTSNNSSKVIAEIKKFPQWIHVKNFVWCVSSDVDRAIDVRDKLRNVIEENDLLMVLDISNSSWAAKNLPSEVVYWLKSR